MTADDGQLAAGGRLPCVAWYRFAGGRIASTQVFFDPRPIMPG